MKKILFTLKVVTILTLLLHVSAFAKKITLETNYSTRTVYVFEDGLEAAKYSMKDTGLLLKSGKDILPKVSGTIEEKVIARDGMKLHGKSSYSKGKRNGKCVLYYENGKLYIEAEMKNDLDNGTQKSYSKDGKLTSQSVFKNGKLNGKSIEYFPNGRVKSEQYYKDGKMTRTKKTYYESGALRSTVNIKDGKAEGELKVFYEDGKVKGLYKVKNGEPYGEFKEYGKDGKITSQGETKGLKSIPSSKKQAAQKPGGPAPTPAIDPNKWWIKYGETEVTFLNDGYWRATYDRESFRLKEGEDVAGGINSYALIEETFGARGKIYGVGQFSHGRRNGEFKYYYGSWGSNRLAAKINYANDMIDGDFVMYYENGRVAEQGTMRGNDTIDYEAYDENGNLDQEESGSYNYGD